MDGRSLPKAAPRRGPRRTGSSSSLVDMPIALAQVRDQDLKNDTWVPDILRHEDDLSDPNSLVLAAANRLDGNAIHDSATAVPVPKSPFFPRNAVTLSLVDRVCFHAVVASFAHRIEEQLDESVFSAHLAGRSSALLANGRNAWLAWRRAVVAELDIESKYMVVTDVTSYFDFIKHEILIPDLREIGVDDRLVVSLRRMLKEWAPAPNTGIPQGPDASRILGNFYLVPVDQAMRGLPGIRYFRYMDDIRIVGSSRSAVIGALQTLDQECRRRGLALSTKKTELRYGEDAIRSMVEPELDAAQYAFDASRLDDKALRKELGRLFRRAFGSDGTVRTRWARFSLVRLFQLRDRSVLTRVLDALEDLAPLGDLVAKYLHPWLRRPSTQRRLTAYLTDSERNTSVYLSTWLLAGMLDVPDTVPAQWVSYARSVALDHAQPTFHRAIALNVLVLGKELRDLDSVREIARREHDPELVRAALVGLRRIDRLTRDDAQHAERLPSLEPTLTALRQSTDLPSLIFSSRRIPIGTARR